MGKGICLCMLLLVIVGRYRTCGKQYTLNVPRVLLPYVPPSGARVKSNFTLRSEHGCFTWYLLALLTWPLLCIEC